MFAELSTFSAQEIEGFLRLSSSSSDTIRLMDEGKDLFTHSLPKKIKLDFISRRMEEKEVVVVRVTIDCILPLPDQIQRLVCRLQRVDFMAGRERNLTTAITTTR